MNKRAVLDAIIARLAAEVNLLTKAALETHAEATSEENKAENKYDTRGLEASYLAQGQSRAAEEAAQALAQFHALAPRDFVSAEPIALGALVSVADKTGAATHYFIGPRAGGTEIECGGQTVMVITPSSPLGRQLVGRREGDTLQLERGGKRSEFRVDRVA